MHHFLDTYKFYLVKHTVGDLLQPQNNKNHDFTNAIFKLDTNIKFQPLQMNIES